MWKPDDHSAAVEAYESFVVAVEVALDGNCLNLVGAYAAAYELFHNVACADLERQLQDCLNRKPEVVEAEPEALATIYFPIGVSRLTREDKNIVNAVADVLKADASKKYDVKGYADTYTGSDAINNRLRNQRAGNVVKQLVSRGRDALWKSVLCAGLWRA